MAAVPRQAAGAPLLAASLAALALVLSGCDQVKVDRTAVLGAEGRTLTDISDVIRSLNFTVKEFKDAGSGIELRGVDVWNYKVPDLTVSELEKGDSRFRLQVDNVHTDIHIEYLKADAAGQTWEIESIIGVLEGTFHTEVTADLSPPYAVDFRHCSATPTVTVSHLQRKTWHTADNFGLGGIVNIKVKEALEGAAEKIFQEQLCGAYKLSEKLEGVVDEALEHKLGKAAGATRAQLESPYDWRDSKVLQWMAAFNEHAHRNRFSIKGALEPFLEGLGTQEGHCMLGPKDQGCSFEVPEDVADRLQRSWNTTDGRTFNLTMENLEVRLVDFTIPTVKLPQLDEQDHQAIGFDLAVAPLVLKARGDLVMRSDAYDAPCDIRKHSAVDVSFTSLAAKGSFLAQVDADKYNALALDQQASLACADSIMTDFALKEFRPHIGLGGIGIHVDPDGDDQEATDKLVKGLQEVVDKLLVTGIHNAGEKIDGFLSAKAFEVISGFVNSKDGVGGLAQSLGQDLGECPSKPSLVQAVGWAMAAACAFACSAALLAMAVRCPKELRPPTTLLSPRCLASLPLTAPHWRLCVPVFTLGCILLYIESNTGVAAVMTVFLTSEANPDVEVHRLEEFGVVKSVWDLWDADMKGLAMLLFTFSVVFPYVKLSLCLVCWLLPIRQDIRGRLLWGLNVLAKWSLLDAYVLMTLMGLGALETRMHGGISVAVYIDPRPSFVSFLVATILSFALGELILSCHEANILDHDVPNRSGDGSFRVPACMLLISLLLLVVSSTLNITTFEVQGLVGWFLNFLADDAGGNKSSFSLFGLGIKLWRVTSDAHRWEAVFMQLIYFLSTFAMNMVFALGACAYAIFRCPGNVARRLHACLPILFACSAADVFAFGVILTVIEMQTGSLVHTPGWMRDQIEEILRPRIRMPGASNDLIQIVPRVEAGAWMLAVAAVTFAVAGHLFLDQAGSGEPLDEDSEDERTGATDELTKATTTVTWTMEETDSDAGDYSVGTESDE